MISRGHESYVRILRLARAANSRVYVTPISYIGNYNRYTILYAPLMYAGPFIFTLVPLRE